MSDSREALAEKLIEAVTAGFAYRDDSGERCESEGPYLDYLNLDWVLVDGRCNFLAAVDALLAEFLVIPRNTVGTEFASVSVVVEGDHPGELVSIGTLTGARVDIQSRTTGARVYFAGSATATADEVINLLFERVGASWLVWGGEYLRITAFTHAPGHVDLRCSQASDTGFAMLDGVETALRIVEPSPPRPIEEWLPAERCRAIRDLVGDGRRPSVLVPGARNSDGMTSFVRCNPWATIIQEGGSE